MRGRQFLAQTSEEFRAAGVENPRHEAKIILAHVLGCTLAGLHTRCDDPLATPVLEKAQHYTAQRLQGQPMAYVLGYKYFYKSKFYVNPYVLIPRPETELLVEHVLNFLDLKKPSLKLHSPSFKSNSLKSSSKKLSTTEAFANSKTCDLKNNLKNHNRQNKNSVFKKGHIWRIIDLGTGSGCVGLSVLHECPQAQLLAVDICDKALQVAQKNARKFVQQQLVDRPIVPNTNQHNAEQHNADTMGSQNSFKSHSFCTTLFQPTKSGKIYFLQKDAALLEAADLPSDWQGQCDVVVANPPYIDANYRLAGETNFCTVPSSCLAPEVVQYEPHKALFAGQGGFEAIFKWSKTAHRLLRPGGLWAFEMAYDQRPQVEKFFKNNLAQKNLAIKKQLDFQLQGVFKDLAGHDRVVLARRL